ncbi:tRNA dihydrouridine synthase DusB [Pseudohoeflea coraliihabitans]|uniref:tRNA-dihydrouridine synthase n=1 Tax=Pseudohoeflea coraliihabitans TaxID=2860393 RepID=A0ABS6WR79_9HYPH|nr:tRNA dihydrouridine synthase DusB [Pseudohoeflea sp. DP4N28-3]MBW3098458.1 tRNA dihydrouridine synthase DusB [Pseudohoeflea sp. DP4N28-3]
MKTAARPAEQAVAATVTNLASELNIAGVPLRNRVFLAPMSGVTDLPFRRLAASFGAGMVVTEMVASQELVTHSRESWARLRGAGLSPHVVQLAGREAHWMAEAARIAEGEGAAIIDINMGCPAKKVTGGYSGSALMREPTRALSMIEATVAAVSVPVTLKMRLGWDENSLNAADLARAAEQAGIQMISVHGRTRCQFYKGRADWPAIARVRGAVSVPFVANGDIRTAEDARQCLAITGADAVMIGRGAQGQPWLCGEIAGSGCQPATPAARASIAVNHYAMMLEHYGIDVGLRHARKHLGWYLDAWAPATPRSQRLAIMTGESATTVERLLCQALSHPAEGAADRADAA